jgi:hypothetical protein
VVAGVEVEDEGVSGGGGDAVGGEGDAGGAD